MKGKPRQNERAVKEFIEALGSGYTHQEVATLFSIPERTIRTWYWEVSCVAKGHDGSGLPARDLGPSSMLMRAPLTAAGSVCRMHRRRRDAANRRLRAVAA